MGSKHLHPPVIARGNPNASVLLGVTPEEQALVEQWIHFCDTEVLASSKPVRTRFLRPLSKPDSTQKIRADYVARLGRAFNTLEKVLETKTFLVSERMTLADIHVASVYLRAANWYLDKTNIDKFPSVVRFVETVLNQPQIARFWTVQWPEKAATYTPSSGGSGKREEKTKSAERPKKQKKEVKPKQKEPEPEEEEDDLVPKEEPKPKHPLDSLPKSTFNLEDWKRAYSNKDTKGQGGSIEWFYEQ